MYTGKWEVLSDTKAIMELNEYPLGKVTIELTEAPQIVKYSYTYKGEFREEFHAFCYDQDSDFAKKVLIPKLKLSE